MSATAAGARATRLTVGTSWRAAVPAAVAIVAVVVVGLSVQNNGFWLLVASTAAIAYIFTGSFNVIFGSAGLFCLSHASVYGVGAYTSVVLESTYGWSFLPATAVAVLAACVTGLLVAVPTARLEGVFLALGTLAFAVAASTVFVNWTEVTGGAQGFLGIVPPTVAGRDLIGGTIDYYWLVGACAVASFLVLRQLSRSSIGRQFVAIRESELASQAAGINPVRARMLAFAVSGAFAGFAGVLTAHLTLFISPESFALHAMIQVLIVTLIGGAGYLYGPVIGVAALVGINQFTQQSGDGGPLIFGAAVILIISFAPTGLMGLLERARNRWLPGRVPGGAGTAITSSTQTPDVVDTAVAEQVLSTQDRPPAGALRVEGVSQRFAGVLALDDVSLHIEPGEVVGLIGPNGAGKTTLVNAITGRVRPTDGTIRLGDQSLVGLKPFEVARRGVTRTFQTTHLIPTFDLLTNVLIARDGLVRASLAERLLHVGRSRRGEIAGRRTARELLRLVGVGAHEGRRAEDTPYGILRRSEIARAMALEPSYLLLDEPGAGLSAYERDEVVEAIRAVADAGVGCLLIDHNVQFVAQACDRLVVLANGSVLTAGPTDEVLAHPDVMEAYLGKAALA
jgi:branched-chain amino acid transport system permease protein